MKIPAKLLILAAILFALVIPLFARAGGAGGDFSFSSSGDSDGGEILIIIDILLRLFFFLWEVLGPIPTVIIFAVLIALLIFWRSRAKHKKRNVYANIPKVFDKASQEAGSVPARKIPGYQDFIKRNPDWDEPAFLTKVQTAFVEIQKAWSQSSLAGVRRFISDGVYQRFSTQFLMMKLLHQTNELSNIKIHAASIDRVETDGPYDIAHVAIQASMLDEFVSETFPNFNQRSLSSFVEYWSFIRKQKNHTGSKSHDTGAQPSAATWSDLYQDTSCPNCGAQLPADLGERGQCPYCSTLVNSGEYDWVLSEISQLDDYTRQRNLANVEKLSEKLKAIRKEDPVFCAQLIEDKASNAFMQVIAARTLQEPLRIRRFVSEKLYAQLEKSFQRNSYIYNRLWLNSVNLITIRQGEDRNELALSVTMTSQRVQLDSQKAARLVDPAPIEEQFVIRLQRDRVTAGEAKGSVYMHQCSSCGSPIQDSLSTSCTYCGQAYNAGRQEWVLTGIETFKEYRDKEQEEPQKAKVALNLNVLDNLYDVKDFAFNNLLVMIAADGVFADEERVVAEAFVKKLGYKIQDMNALFQLAASGSMGIKMPNDVSKRNKIIKLMEEVAQSDGRVSDEEKALLEHIKNSYVLSNPVGF